jgi:hypothetical protein
VTQRDVRLGGKKHTNLPPLVRMSKTQSAPLRKISWQALDCHASEGCRIHLAILRVRRCCLSGLFHSSLCHYVTVVHSRKAVLFAHLLSVATRGSNWCTRSTRRKFLLPDHCRFGLHMGYGLERMQRVKKRRTKPRKRRSVGNPYAIIRYHTPIRSYPKA